MKCVALLCICAVLAACGNSGPLYLPEKRSAEVPAANPEGSTEDPADKTRKSEQPPVKP